MATSPLPSGSREDSSGFDAFLPTGGAGETRRLSISRTDGRFCLGLMGIEGSKLPRVASAIAYQHISIQEPLCFSILACFLPPKLARNVFGQFVFRPRWRGLVHTRRFLNNLHSSLGCGASVPGRVFCRGSAGTERCVTAMAMLAVNLRGRKSASFAKNSAFPAHFFGAACPPQKARIFFPERKLTVTGQKLRGRKSAIQAKNCVIFKVFCRNRNVELRARRSHNLLSPPYVRVVTGGDAEVAASAPGRRELEGGRGSGDACQKLCQRQNPGLAVKFESELLGRPLF